MSHPSESPCAYAVLEEKGIDVRIALDSPTCALR